jgi:hypothetical protein
MDWQNQHCENDYIAEGNPQILGKICNKNSNAIFSKK